MSVVIFFTVLDFERNCSFQDRHQLNFYPPIVASYIKPSLVIFHEHLLLETTPTTGTSRRKYISPDRQNLLGSYQQAGGLM